MAERQHIGRYQKEQVPNLPLAYQFLDDTGQPIDLVDVTAVYFATRGPCQAVRVWPATTTVPRENGIVQVDWSSAMTNTVGTWEGVFWIEPGPDPSDTLIWTVLDSPGPNGEGTPGPGVVFEPTAYLAQGD